MISVLCPTRLRPDRLADSLESLQKTGIRGNYEVLLAVDPDDLTDYELFDVDQVIRFGERPGYGRLHEYYNELARSARGEWLMLWNDDCVMTTDRWDQIIEAESPALVLAPHSHHDPLITLPIIPRAWTIACGHYAELLHVDSWWQDLGHLLGAVEWIDIVIDHQRFDKPGHETEPDEVYQQRDFRLHELHQEGSAARTAWLADVATVRNLLGR